MAGGADLVSYSTRVGPCDSGVGTFGRSQNVDEIVSAERQMIHLKVHDALLLIISSCYYNYFSGVDL